MGKARRLATYGALIVISLALAVGIAFYLVPIDAYEGYIERAASENIRFSVEVSGLQKTLPFSFRAAKVRLSGKDGLLMEMNDMEVWPALSSLPGSLNIGFAGFIGNGRISGRTALWPSRELVLRAEGVDGQDLPFLSGVAENGVYSARARISSFGDCLEGEIEASSEKLRLKGRLDPFMIFKDGVAATLTAGLKDCTARIRSLTVEGKDISARAYGEVQFKGDLDLTIELTPRGQLNDTAAVLLSSYRKSANYFTVRVKGPVSNPAFLEPETER